MIEANFLIESIGNNRFSVERSLKELVENIKKDRDIEVLKTEIGEVQEDEGSYSCIAELDLKFKDLKSFITGVIKYPPSALMLNSPEEVTLSNVEFQELLAIAGNIINNFYTSYNAGFVFKNVKEKLEPVDEDDIYEHIEQGAIRVGVLLKRNGEDINDILGRVIDTLEGDIDYIKAEEMSLEVGDVAALDLLIYPPSSIFELVIKHLPMVIKVVEPEEITLSMLDLQEIGITLAEVINDVMIQKAVLK